MTTTYAPELVEVADSPEALLDLLEARGLGDGLPVLPPTEERVAAMLEHATGDPDEVLFTLLPRAGIATRRVVAINAVLAGCRPEHFPVVLTALRALAQPEVNLRGVNATTHPVAPLVLVSGEIVKSAGFWGGVGAFGPATGRTRRWAEQYGSRCCTWPAPSRVSVMRPPTANPRNTRSALRKTSRSRRGSRTPAAGGSTRRPR